MENLTGTEEEYDEVFDKLADTFGGQDPIFIISALSVFITNLITACAPTEMAAQKTLATVAATMLLNGSVLIAEHYEEDIRPQ